MKRFLVFAGIIGCSLGLGVAIGSLQAKQYKVNADADATSVKLDADPPKGMFLVDNKSASGLWVQDSSLKNGTDRAFACIYFVKGQGPVVGLSSSPKNEGHNLALWLDGDKPNIQITRKDEKGKVQIRHIDLNELADLMAKIRSGNLTLGK